MPADAVRAYHDLLAADPALAADSRAALDLGQEARGLVYAGRPVCRVLRPRFLTPHQYRFLHDRVRDLLPALRAVQDRALADPGFRRQLRLRDWDEALLDIDPGYPDPSPTGRFDAFVGHAADLRFTEYNAETPAGAGYADSLARLFHAVPAFQEFGRQFQAWPVSARPGVLHALTDSFRRWRGTSGEPPRVAILDRRDDPAFAELVLFYDYFKGMGAEARTADPRDLEYRDGKLTAGDFHVNLVYRRVPADDLVTPGGPDHPLIQAARDKAVCVVNSFRGVLLNTKAAFAALSDERTADLFTPRQRAVIADHVPWTRLVEERKTMHAGVEVDLVPFVLAHKDRLVLRPNAGHGAEGTVSGWAVDAGAWEAAVSRALASPFVVQERVDLPAEPYPAFEGDRLTVRDRLVETSPFVGFGAFMHGCLTRVADAAPVNVAAGGSVVPTFVVEPR